MFDEGPEKDEYLESLPVILKDSFKFGPTSSYLPVAEWSSIELSVETVISIVPDTRYLSTKHREATSE